MRIMHWICAYWPRRGRAGVGNHVNHIQAGFFCVRFRAQSYFRPLTWISCGKNDCIRETTHVNFSLQTTFLTNVGPRRGKC